MSSLSEKVSGVALGLGIAVGAMVLKQGAEDLMDGLRKDTAVLNTIVRPVCADVPFESGGLAPIVRGALLIPSQSTGRERFCENLYDQALRDQGVPGQVFKSYGETLLGEGMLLIGSAKLLVRGARKFFPARPRTSSATQQS